MLSCEAGEKSPAFQLKPETTMQTYNAIIRNNAKLENEVEKKNLTAPEVLVLRKIHGSDGVVRIESSGDWEEHFGLRKVKEFDDSTGQHVEVEKEFDYDDDVEKNRLAYTYGDAIMKEEDEGNGRAAIDRMFGEFAPLPNELPEIKKARKAAAKAALKTPAAVKKGNLDKVT